jgi:hypothetical protein
LFSPTKWRFVNASEREVMCRCHECSRHELSGEPRWCSELIYAIGTKEYVEVDETSALELGDF